MYHDLVRRRLLFSMAGFARLDLRSWGRGGLRRGFWLGGAGGWLLCGLTFCACNMGEGIGGLVVDGGVVVA